jgi:hypothetical protein
MSPPTVDFNKKKKTKTLPFWGQLDNARTFIHRMLLTPFSHLEQLVV